ncbi:tir domain-containing protein [Leptolyngbya sp. Heron Island J]|uniref:TIR domain-containing protein n=1 Tax=Leptolyngbya sp. Heron Island J TaxID=1385935 RepID=UPI0003B94257|nr:TIR domain-containing protein [Leptolyngbya sp. Heron Island J]ESA34523.1 tir domain-containing protein [Leptolyngbya sp. Heron Island J]
MPKILILAANPNDTTRLRIGEEVRDISEGLQRASHRDQFEIVQRWAVRPRDLQRAMLEESPQIVHFSGHGAGDAGLYFEGVSGNSQLVTGTALASLFKLIGQKSPIDCVLLNGCYSQAQAEAIVEHVPYVIGMRDSMGDRAAIEFAVGFYDALGAGESVEFAFESGKVAMALNSTGYDEVPVLLRGNVHPKTQQKSAPETKSQIKQPPTAISNSAPNEPLGVFISYSHRDEELKEELEMHLSALKRQGKIKPWQDRAIEAGTEWDAEIKTKLEAAQIILLLVTPRFLFSEYINDIELKRAMERHEAGTARVIPIILKPVDFKGTPFAKLQALPKDAKPVTRWDDQDEAFVNVVRGIRRVVEALSG